MTLDSLVRFLSNNGIDISLYGQGKAKTLENLHQEIESGETVLRTVPVRYVSVVSVDVRCMTNNGEMRLIEDRQVFADGRERKRDYLYGAVSEKMNPGEHPRIAIARGLAEELQVSNFTISHLYDPKVKIDMSPSYPGLLSHCTTYEVRVLLNISDFDSDGYKETQDNKTTYFVWKAV